MTAPTQPHRPEEPVLAITQWAHSIRNRGPTQHRLFTVVRSNAIR